ncbi:hypothetical protein Y032_0200g1704 [Ancylostoma ceylanicum]|uniref:Uncharacterized protein n=2 Tax=Ancylostoma ceylanicum TaxID=53326 RepID=A0A016SNN3_9BILA|nr:hypothetical protein Y032_0200g1704 [Ancylostoma ceylanicum]
MGQMELILLCRSSSVLTQLKDFALVLGRRLAMNGYFGAFRDAYPVRQPPRPLFSWNEGWNAPFQFQPGPRAFANEAEPRFFEGPVFDHQGRPMGFDRHRSSASRRSFLRAKRSRTSSIPSLLCSPFPLQNDSADLPWNAGRRSDACPSIDFSK